MLEMKADTYKSAFLKARTKGDDREDKFLDAYIKKLKDETPEGDKLAAKITKWVKKDKQQILKLNEFCDDDSWDEFNCHKGYETMIKNYVYEKYKPFGINFYVAHKDNDNFFYRFDNYLEETFLHINNGLFKRVFSEKYAKGNEGKRFVIIECNSSYYIYYSDDKKLSYIDHIQWTNANTSVNIENYDTTEKVRNMLKDLGI